MEPEPTPLYRRLSYFSQEIRLVILLPGDASAPIECRLVYIDLVSTKDYFHEALSYMWGSPQNEKRIVLDGRSVLVRENLYLAMHQLRLPDSERTIWIDAISINQENIKERGLQVGMRDIYSSAKTVNVWLGPELYWNEEAFRLLNDLKDRGIKAQNMSIIWNLATKRKMLELYTKLCNLEYWTRVWIVQEIIVAKDVNIHCGKYSIDWNTFSDVLQEFLPTVGDIGLGWAPRNEFRKLSSSPAYNIHRQRRIRNSKLKDCRFIPLLEACENSVSHDPRDRIYGC